MTNYKCPFCKSKKKWLDTPYIDRVTGEKTKTPCCEKQSRNMKFRDKRYSKDIGDVPDLEDIAKI